MKRIIGSLCEIMRFKKNIHRLQDEGQIWYVYDPRRIYTLDILYIWNVHDPRRTARAKERTLENWPLLGEISGQRFQTVPVSIWLTPNILLLLESRPYIHTHMCTYIHIMKHIVSLYEIKWVKKEKTGCMSRGMTSESEKPLYEIHCMKLWFRKKTFTGCMTRGMTSESAKPSLCACSVCPLIADVCMWFRV